MPALIVGSFLNVLSEANQPSRLIYGYFLGWQYWDTAIIKYGIILLPLFLALCWWLTFQAMDRRALGAAIGRLSPAWRPWANLFSLWSQNYSVLDATVWRRWIVGVLILVGSEALIRSGAGYQAFSPSAEMLRDSGFSLVAVLGVLLLTLPADRAPELNTSTRVEHAPELNMSTR